MTKKEIWGWGGVRTRQWKASNLRRTREKRNSRRFVPCQLTSRQFTSRQIISWQFVWVTFYLYKRLKACSDQLRICCDQQLLQSIAVKIDKIGWERWSSGYGWRLMFVRLWVRIPAPYTGSTFFTLICLKRPKMNEKEAVF